MKNLLLLFASTIVSFVVSAQTHEDMKGLFGQKWVTDAYTVANVKVGATDVQAEDGTEFFADGTYRSVDKGVTVSGKWSYRPESHVIYVEPKGDTPRYFKVKTLKDNTLVLEITEASGEQMTVEMKAASKGN